MPFDPVIAATRFGTGLSPRIAAPVSAQAMIDLLAGPDLAARDWPIPGLAAAEPPVAAFRALNRLRRSDDPAVAAEAAAAMEAARARAADLRLATFGANLARGMTTADGLRERLVRFWANHFTVRSRNGFTHHLVAPYVEDAIRPHVLGPFSALLRAAITHPMMLSYLDQSESMGPNSPAAQRRDRGLNENLARELLELHTLGVDGPYGQQDVRELAELLTGLVWDTDGSGGVAYRPGQAEPGAETVLARTYAPDAALSTVHAALDDLAVHPATARHLSARLARHFIADDPPADLVETLAARFTATGGDLMAVTRALLDHPAAWSPERLKVLPPFDFVTAALRVLDVAPTLVASRDLRWSRRLLQNPLATMGQGWEAPPGPDGWPDRAADWITPQFMAARIDWAMRMPERLLPALPDPRSFAEAALGHVPGPVALAAAAAEDRPTGIGLVLASAMFQRR